MNIEWSQNNNKNPSNWHYGKIHSQFRVEVDPNTEGSISWLIFHDDFKNVVYGNVTDTIYSVKEKADARLKTNVIANK